MVEGELLVLLLFETQDGVDIVCGAHGFTTFHRRSQLETCWAALRADFCVLLSASSPAFSARARASHLVRRSSISSSVRCSMPTSELRAVLTRMSSSSLTWMAALSRF